LFVKIASVGVVCRNAMTKTGGCELPIRYVVLCFLSFIVSLPTWNRSNDTKKQGTVSGDEITFGASLARLGEEFEWSLQGFHLRILKQPFPP
jgi:hypothetical protein